MKYLKLFESSVDELKNLIHSKVNYEMIDSICDMALDGLDEELQLFIHINISGRSLLYFYFDHKRKDIKLDGSVDNIYIKTNIFDKLESDKLSYVIQFLSPIGYTKRSVFLLEELVKRAKEAYPNENLSMPIIPESIIGESVKSVNRVKQLTELIESKINYDMIESICDMSLDYIDQGCTLKIQITDSSDSTTVLCNFKYNHRTADFDTCVENNLSDWYIDELLGNLKLSYFIYLVKFGTSSLHGQKTHNQTIEIINRAKLVYPDEEIYCNY